MRTSRAELAQRRTKETHLASVIRLDCTVVGSAALLDTGDLAGLQTLSSQAELRFDFGRIAGSNVELNRRIRNHALLAIGRPAPDFRAHVAWGALSNWCPSSEARLIRTHPSAQSFRPTTLASPLSAPVEQPLSALVLRVRAEGNPGVSFASVLDVLVAIDYDADLP